jgi:hypothetical protein
MVYFSLKLQRKNILRFSVIASEFFKNQNYSINTVVLNLKLMTKNVINSGFIGVKHP